MNQAYEQLTAVLDPGQLAQWESDVLEAEANRGDSLDIYLLKGEKGQYVPKKPWACLMACSPYHG